MKRGSMSSLPGWHHVLERGKVRLLRGRCSETVCCPSLDGTTRCARRATFGLLSLPGWHHVLCKKNHFRSVVPPWMAPRVVQEEPLSCRRFGVVREVVWFSLQ
ncbi:hypothetical protein E2C01_054772 [Portunus trituberculatus]|uniref:Uncharacterized protein n=1 Tax=Portunus trituberculatus TaxID=210409 RepID=A0A5B7GT40_PORTR|nr:hypothetical protein [Portunus trituberculatus]